MNSFSIHDWHLQFNHIQYYEFLPHVSYWMCCTIDTAVGHKLHNINDVKDLEFTWSSFVGWCVTDIVRSLVWSDIPTIELPEDMAQFEELFARKKKSVGGSCDSIAQSMITRAPKVTSHAHIAPPSLIAAILLGRHGIGWKEIAFSCRGDENHSIQYGRNNTR